MYLSTNKRKARPKTSTINYSDFVRIQREIIPVDFEGSNRKDYDNTLKNKNKAMLQRFPDKTKKNFKERQKDEYIEDEIKRRKIDEFERKLEQTEKDNVNSYAKQRIIENQDDIKTFKSQLLVSDVMKEREYQMQIKKQKEDIEKQIEDKFYQQQLQQMADYDKKEEDKKNLEKQKRIMQFNIIDEQVRAQEMKNIQDIQEKKVEGILMKQQIADNLKEDEENYRKLKQKQEENRQEFIKANKELERLKKEKIEKDKEEQRKIEEYAIKKDQLEEVKKKVAKEKFDEKLRQRQKMIDVQAENLRKIKEKQNNIVLKQIKEQDEKKKKEEEEKERRLAKWKKDIEEDRKEKIKEKEDKKRKERAEEKNFIEDWKKKMKQIEKDEIEEKTVIRNRNKDLADFHREQVKEKELRAKAEFEKNIAESYKRKDILRNEHDYYYEYVTEKINEYKSQGKDITPLMIELHKYKKRNGIE